jgi:hypothetical protein
MRNAVKNRRASQSDREPAAAKAVLEPGAGESKPVTPAQAFRLAILATIWKTPVRQAVVNRLATRNEKDLGQERARKDSKKPQRDSVTAGR